MAKDPNHQSARESFLSLLPLPNRSELAWAMGFFVLISLGYFLTRLFRLTIMPIFTDEAIYLRWAQIALHDPQWRFISLTDGKQPLFVWLAMVAMKFISDPLVAGRLISVLAGWVGLGLIWLLARELFGPKTGYLAVMVGFFLPITFLYSRIALMETLLFTFGTASVLLAVLLAKYQRLDLALLLGAAVGAALLTKSPGNFYLYLLPASLLYFPWPRSDRLGKLVTWLVLIGVAVAVSQMFFNILRLSPWLHMVKTKDNNFILTFAEFRANPGQWLPGNLRAFKDWLIGYLTWPVWLLVLAGFLGRFKNNWRPNLLLLAYFAVPLLASAAFGKIIYARYLMFFVMPLIILAGQGLNLLAGLVNYARFKRLSYLFLVGGWLFFFGLAGQTDYYLLTNPVRAQFPDNDKNQYVNDWPAGYGVPEVAAFINAKANRGRVTVATEGTFGLMPHALELYLVTNPNVKILSYWPVKEIPPEVLARAALEPTYFVFNETQEIPPNFPLSLVGQYPKGDGKTFLKLFKVAPQAK